jgi:hypothetical protein
VRHLRRRILEGKEMPIKTVFSESGWFEPTAGVVSAYPVGQCSIDQRQNQTSSKQHQNDDLRIWREMPMNEAVLNVLTYLVHRSANECGRRVD